jgi:hypothetical protein
MAFALLLGAPLVHEHAQPLSPVVTVSDPLFPSLWVEQHP